MNLLHAILLGLVQGLTEFLPVSSTAHLTLAENLMLGRSMPLAFDVLLHMGTLSALLIFFRREILQVMKGILGREPEGRRLAWWLFLAMIPTGVFAMATRPLKEAQKGHIWLYGVFLLLTAGLLWATNTLAAKRKGRAMNAMNAWDAFAVGSIQGLGGGFGLSRSGSTISVGVFCGLDLASSVRFSFLLGIPTIAAAALVEGSKLLKPLLKGQPLSADLAFPVGSASPMVLCAAGVVMAALSGYAAIGLLEWIARKPRLNGFALYCVAAGLFLLFWGTQGR